MSTLTVTAKGQVTLRKDLLDHLGVHPGEKITVDKLPDGRIEVKAAQFKRHGLKLRDRMIGDLPRYAPWASKFSWLLNLSKPFQGLAGFAAQRSLPKWRGETFLSTTAADASDATVVLFVDTFANNFEPEVLTAARRVLEAAGHRVAVARAPSGERAPRNHADSRIGAERQHLSLLFPVEQVIEILHADERGPAALARQRQSLRELPGIHGRGAEVAHLS